MTTQSRRLVRRFLIFASWAASAMLFGTASASEPNARSIAALAAELGLDARTVTAAGLMPRSQEFLEHLHSLDEPRAAYWDATDALATESAELAALTSLLAESPGDPAAAEAVLMAAANVDLACSILESRKCELQDSALSIFTSPERQKLHNLLATDSIRLPIEFRVVARSPESWRLLKAAHSEIRMAQLDELPPPAESVDAIESARTVAVTEAAMHLSTSLSATLAVFASFDSVY